VTARKLRAVAAEEVAMINDVIIVGGGTAGWMTATYLKASFGERISVTLVESGRVPTIGVGEATFSTITNFFDYLGLDESEWMADCHATYKLAIRFEDWNEAGRQFYHPFERLPRIDGFSLADWWQVHEKKGRFDQDSFIIAALCEARCSPRQLDGRLFAGDLSTGPSVIGRTTLMEQLTQFPYAYHFDAALLAQFLMRRGTEWGVRRVVDDVVGVNRDERGWIDCVITRDGGPLRGDLYVDCTGFRSALLGSALGEPFLSFQDSLPNDRAVALRVPIDIERAGIAPYTRATAQEAGWIWTIPLYGRNGVGYVYSSEFCEPDQAEHTLRGFVGPAASDLEANHIRMRVGRSRNSWVGNCVAIGLASGFVEPLESTGIFFIQHAVEQLVKNFPDNGWNETARNRYNRLVANCIDGVREFLIFHYYGSRRADTPYWKATKERDIPGTLLQRVREWRTSLPDTENIWPYFHGFEPYSYIAMLFGLGGISTRARPAVAAMDNTLAERAFADLHKEAERLCRTLPSHYEYLAARYSQPAPA
jgi:flavin-dependent dehydrogenase